MRVRSKLTFCLFATKSLSGLTTLGFVNIARLNIWSLIAAGGWSAATFTLSQIIPRKKEAQAMVEERIQDEKKTK